MSTAQDVSRQHHDRLRDFTADWHVIVPTTMAVVVGCVGLLAQRDLLRVRARILNEEAKRHRVLRRTI